MRVISVRRLAVPRCGSRVASSCSTRSSMDRIVSLRKVQNAHRDEVRAATDLEPDGERRTGGCENDLDLVAWAQDLLEAKIADAHQYARLDSIQDCARTQRESDLRDT